MLSDGLYFILYDDIFQYSPYLNVDCMEKYFQRLRLPKLIAIPQDKINNTRLYWRD